MRRVLIIEDEAELVSGYRRMLAGLMGEIEVDAVTTAPRGIKQMQVENYDLVLCDGNLDLGKGKDVWRWMKETNDRHLKRTCIVTGDSSSYHGQVDIPVYTKPLERDTLKNIIEGICGKGTVRYEEKVRMEVTNMLGESIVAGKSTKKLVALVDENVSILIPIIGGISRGTLSELRDRTGALEVYVHPWPGVTSMTLDFRFFESVQKTE